MVAYMLVASQGKDGLEFLFQMIAGQDFCFTWIVAAMFFVLGDRLVAGREDLRACGKKCGVVSFIVYSAVAWDRFPPRNGDYVAGIFFRGFLAMALGTGVCWAVLSILVFSFDHTLGTLLREMKRARQQRELQDRLDKDRLDRAAQSKAQRDASRMEQPKPHTPTPDDDFDKAHEIFRRNCERIRRSELPDDEKNELVEQERQVLRERVQRTLE